MIQLEDGTAPTSVLIIGRTSEGERGLQAALNEQGLDWQVRRVEDADAALAAVTGDAIDIVVADARAIGQRAVGLLDEFRRHHPEAVRLLMLGDQGEPPDAAMMEIAHRILSHPLCAEELVETVYGVLELRELLDSPRLKGFVGRITDLPPAPSIYLELTQALRDPECTTARLIGLVSKDPALAARVLRLCNSAYFSGGRTITDLRSAVIRLGAGHLGRLVLASEVFAHAGTLPAGEREALQHRALESSRIALNLLSDASADLAATACLLAEVGKLLPGVDRSEPEDDDAISAIEPGYADVGAYLLGLWGLPLPIVEAVANQHRPGRSGHGGFWVTGAVHVARALASQRPVDERYLASVAVTDRLPEWLALVAEGNPARMASG